jgi:predicted amidohydrolase
MKAGFYQFSPVFGKRDENLKKVLSALKNTELDLLVLPEFFATGYQFVSAHEVRELSEPIQGGHTTGFLSDLSHEKDMYIVAGLPEKEGDTFYNSAILTGPEGFMGTYRKTHLFFEEKLYFSPGNSGFQVWHTRVGIIGIMVCFDWFFPESMRALAMLGAEVIAHPSNLVLPYCPQVMPIRCLENRVFAITANRTGSEKRKKEQALNYIGQSQIVSPGGEVLVKASENEEELLTIDIEPQEARNKSLNSFNDILKDRRPEYYDPF